MRHEFFPGRLLAGIVLMVAAGMYLADAGGVWTAPWWVAVPVVCGGLVVAGSVGALAQLVRVRRRRRRGD
ncbi:hypothetical protein GTW43_32490 [Streptomyces sp. SID5785]|uniref:hypothetical protein n=1 Tax=Streptomyces sp. SID5785 TaxID=2690309 RepID=UPI001360C959|nr:hypothetical protein [Streptomyces sp. SID5785]MZD09766.1 hypothetical protein [Streptomyces sp. SID5785]